MGRPLLELELVLAIHQQEFMLAIHQQYSTLAKTFTIVVGDTPNSSWVLENFSNRRADDSTKALRAPPPKLKGAKNLRSFPRKRLKSCFYD